MSVSCDCSSTAHAHQCSKAHELINQSVPKQPCCCTYTSRQDRASSAFKSAALTQLQRLSRALYGSFIHSLSQGGAGTESAPQQATWQPAWHSPPPPALPPRQRGRPAPHLPAERRCWRPSLCGSPSLQQQGAQSSQRHPLHYWQPAVAVSGGQARTVDHHRRQLDSRSGTPPSQANCTCTNMQFLRALDRRRCAAGGKEQPPPGWGCRAANSGAELDTLRSETAPRMPCTPPAPPASTSAGRPLVTGACRRATGHDKAGARSESRGVLQASSARRRLS